MYHRGAAQRGLSAHDNDRYPRSPMFQSFDFNYQGPPSVNSFRNPSVERLPKYDWKPQPSPSPVRYHQTPAVTNRRKRHNEEYEYRPPVVKRQRLDSSPHPPIGPPLNHAHPPYRPTQAPMGSSRSDFDSPLPGPCSHPSPQQSPHPQVPVVPDSSSSLQAYANDKLSCQMLELFEACQQQVSDLIRKETFRARLQTDIQRIYAVARLYLTGSSMNGLGCRSSDADLCLVIRGNKRFDPIQVLSVLQKMFRSLQYIERIQLIRAKVPILKFRERGSDLEFDLNINNTVGIRNTFLLKSYANADLRIRPMILVIKKWAQHNQINDASKGTLSSYTLVLMVLNYLQTLKNPVLPSLQRDFPDCFDPLMDIDMVPLGPLPIPQYVSTNQSSLGELLLGFLKYYATGFSWDKQVISVREARTLPKNSFREWRNKYICVEEPFERNNVARAVHENFKFEAIKAQFAESWRILKQRKDLNSILPVRAIINKETSRR